MICYRLKTFFISKIALLSLSSHILGKIWGETAEYFWSSLFQGLSNISLSDSEIYFPCLTGDRTVGLNDVMDAISGFRGKLKAMMK